jgi:hypothetical protein
MTTATPRETDLYPPLKGYPEGQGYAVKSEIGAADIVACRGDEEPVIVEMKLGFSLSLFHQAVARQALTNLVYVAVLHGTKTSAGPDRETTIYLWVLKLSGAECAPVHSWCRRLSFFTDDLKWYPGVRLWRKAQSSRRASNAHSRKKNSSSPRQISKARSRTQMTSFYGYRSSRPGM